MPLRILARRLKPIYSDNAVAVVIPLLWWWLRAPRTPRPAGEGERQFSTNRAQLTKGRFKLFNRKHVGMRMYQFLQQAFRETPLIGPG